jgi:aspartate aminotransferase
MMLYEINEKVMKLEKEGKKIIKFNVGDPDQALPDEIIESMHRALRGGKTKYSSSSGEKELRESLAEIYGVKPSAVTISPGSKWSIYSIMHVLLKGGGNIIIPSPHWTAYDLMAKEIGAEPRILPTRFEDGWKIDTSKLNEMIDGKTKLIILNSPNNPTSKIIDSKTFGEIVEIANDRGIKILSDECYSDISFVKMKSILDFGQNHILVNSFSKTFAMTGLRLGFSITDDELADKLTKLNQITISNVPAFIQHAAVDALKIKERVSSHIREIYKKRAELAEKIFADSSLKFSKPDAPFYMFPYCAEDSEKLAFKLLDVGVAITPGTAFGSYREFFRISLTMPDHLVKEGLEKIVSSLKK